MNANVNLIFPELNGGTVQGLNDAGVENFQGAIDVYLSRECGQNTADAGSDAGNPSRLEFQRLTVRAADIPGFEQLRRTLTTCFNRWKDKGPKEREFFEQAVTLSSQDEISVLRISDYGTTGLSGADTDETGRWFALVKSQGVSNKGETAGGSFGIGKSSPFAASAFRTVFYGTRTPEGAVALQGVSRLVTHTNGDGKPTQGTGFIGTVDLTAGEGGTPVFKAIRDQNSIPAQFRRDSTGTDIWIIGYRSGPEWKDHLVKSILSNFWPAIHRETIQFKVGDITISKSNLAELIAKHAGSEEFEAHNYFPAINATPIKTTLKHTGDCELYLATGNPDLPRKICMVRGTGMRIYDYQPKACRVPFCGLFICTDKEGNKLLRKLEPPKHNIWDPKRVDGPEGKKALDEIKAWIRDEVKKLNPLFSGSSFNETELAKYLPDNPDHQVDDTPEDSTGDASEESLEPKPKKDAPATTSIVTEVLVPVPNQKAKGGGGAKPEHGNGKSSNGKGGGGDVGKGNGSGDGNNGQTAGQPAPPKISVRSFRTAADGSYDLVLRCDCDYTGPVHVYAVGEDGAEPVSLASATVAGSETPLAVKEDAISGVTLTAGDPLRIRAKISAIGRRSLLARAKL